MTINSPFPKLKLTVTGVFGNCYHGYKEGDEIILEDFTHPPQHFCLGLAHVLFPVIYALSFGACFPFRDNQRSLSVTCPDGGKLEFKAEILDGLGKAQQIPRNPSYQGPSPKKCPKLTRQVLYDHQCKCPVCVSQVEPSFHSIKTPALLLLFPAPLRRP